MHASDPARGKHADTCQVRQSHSPTHSCAAHEAAAFRELLCEVCATNLGGARRIAICNLGKLRAGEPDMGHTVKDRDCSRLGTSAADRVLGGRRSVIVDGAGKPMCDDGRLQRYNWPPSVQCCLHAFV